MSIITILICVAITIGTFLIWELTRLLQTIYEANHRCIDYYSNNYSTFQYQQGTQQ